MSLPKQQKVYEKIRRVYEGRFMDGRCTILRHRGYANDNDGVGSAYEVAYTDVPCKVKFFAAAAGKTVEPGLPEIDATLTVPITYLGLLSGNDRFEVTTTGTEALAEPITFAIQDIPLPTATGLRCRVKKLHVGDGVDGGAANE